jgi:Holliday junction resolvase RusA-like endonuclease
MIPEIQIIIPGRPVGAARPRVVRIRGGASHTFMPDNSVRWEEQARQIAARAWGGRSPIVGPAELHLWAIRDRPERLRRRSSPRERIPGVAKPDLDNVVKLAMDALTKAGIWSDDTQVCRIIAEAWYQAIGPHVRGDKPASLEPPRVVLEVFYLPARGPSP